MPIFPLFDIPASTAFFANSHMQFSKISCKFDRQNGGTRNNKFREDHETRGHGSGAQNKVNGDGTHIGKGRKRRQLEMEGEYTSLAE